jgi:hypothetical protein
MSRLDSFSLSRDKARSLQSRETCAEYQPGLACANLAGGSLLAIIARINVACPNRASEEPRGIALFPSSEAAENLEQSEIIFSEEMSSAELSNSSSSSNFTRTHVHDITQH